MCHMLYSTSETSEEILHGAFSLYKPYVTSRAENIWDVESLRHGRRV